MKAHRSLAACALALVAACSAPPLAEGVDPTPDPFDPGQATPTTLGASDLVRVVVFGHPELSSTEFGERVDFLGRINLPLIEPILVAGLSPDEARAAIAVEMGKFVRTPAVSLSVLEHSSRSFYVLGEVMQPGAVPLDRPLTALQALAMGGALSDSADTEKIAVLRGHPDELEVHIFNGATPGRDGMFQIRPNDLIFVRRSRAGSFKEQILPIVQSVAPPLTALASLIIAADRLEN